MFCGVNVMFVLEGEISFECFVKRFVSYVVEEEV